MILFSLSEEKVYFPKTFLCLRAIDLCSRVDHSPLTIDHSGGWFDLSGRKLTGKPTQPGLYINGGRKVVIK